MHERLLLVVAFEVEGAAPAKATENLSGQGSEDLISSACDPGGRNEAIADALADLARAQLIKHLLQGLGDHQRLTLDGSDDYRIELVGGGAPRLLLLLLRRRRLGQSGSHREQEKRGEEQGGGGGRFGGHFRSCLAC
ncbi:hypothetical protein PAHAL_4G336800 [Panicum hallii]|jgi:hypothetical protein|uniref:Uncharacterized protein n=1 Tax=Panicum hallii TaxID=206008 RepID=A0A2S3HMJ9_9POAL|nr:hypothetical protein PAHAL_4G336800 [Panicum hallii]